MVIKETESSSLQSLYNNTQRKCQLSLSLLQHIVNSFQSLFTVSVQLELAGFSVQKVCFLFRCRGPLVFSFLLQSLSLNLASIQLHILTAAACICPESFLLLLGWLSYPKMESCSAREPHWWVLSALMLSSHAFNRQPVTLDCQLEGH